VRLEFSFRKTENRKKEKNKLTRGPSQWEKRAVQEKKENCKIGGEKKKLKNIQFRPTRRPMVGEQRKEKRRHQVRHRKKGKGGKKKGYLVCPEESTSSGGNPCPDCGRP